MCMNIVTHTGMAGKDQLADSVLGGAADYIGDIAAILSKMFYASEQERVSKYGILEVIEIEAGLKHKVSQFYNQSPQFYDYCSYL